MDGGPFMEYAVGSHHILFVRQERLDESVFPVEEDEQYGQVFLDKQVAKGVCGRFTDCGDIVAQRLALVAAVFLARQPSDLDGIQIRGVHRQAALDVGAHVGIVQFRQCGKRAVAPDLVWEQVVEQG